MLVHLHHLSRPKDGEEANGDAVLVQRFEEGERLSVIDGLGHGPAAALAAHRALDALEACPPTDGLEALFHRLGQALRGTRGIAITVLERRGTTLTAAGVGNVGLRVIGGASLSFVGTPGIVGGAVRRLRVTRGAVDGPARLVLHTDGVSSRFELETARAGTAAEAAEKLFAQHALRHDDASVLVVDFDPSG